MTHVRTECHNCEICQHPVFPRDGVCVQQHYYHYNCFRCACCGETLKMRKYEIADGKPYCLEDFLQLFAGQPQLYNFCATAVLLCLWLRCLCGRDASCNGKSLSQTMLPMSEMLRCTRVGWMNSKI
ncbi:uncharacterized protein DEA37_0010454 [Paragonimus westermani]|uniref:LIM zinc-binding domain-containing protein n=1 Tax=Paragonimus westermani TaxID=34504 RepID=A0A5J4NZ37_9TREM|nr:uncharacterized protein DEA37_0010454 [Paragonimus westermani]